MKPSSQPSFSRSWWIALLCAATLPACSDHAVVSPRGTAQPHVSPVRLSFGAVVVGQEARLDFVVSNTGTAALTGRIGAPCPNFALVGDASYSLGPGDSATWGIRFQPGHWLRLVRRGHRSRVLAGGRRRRDRTFGLRRAAQGD